MKRFQWRIAICLIPLLGSMAYLAFKYYHHGEDAFKRGVDLRGGTILVYEREESDLTRNLSDPERKELIDKLAASIKRRIDPTDLKNITVRPAGENRIEIILPLSLKKDAGAEQSQAFTQDDVASIKGLIAEVGSLEFRFLANDRDDTEAIAKAEKYFEDALTNKSKAELLDKLAREGKAPLPPEPPTDNPLVTPDGKTFNVFTTDRGKLTYAWVELDRGERKSLDLDNAAKEDATQGEQGPRSTHWNQAKAARDKGEPFRSERLKGALLWSRECKDVKLRNEERERKIYEYFVLTREPERDPVTGEPKRISGEYLSKAEEGSDKSLRPAVHFVFNAQGGNLFYDLTSKNTPDQQSGFFRFLAIILDGRVVSAPTLREAIRTDGQISGNFTKVEVQKLVSILRSGALPATLKPVPVSENTMGPTLGADTIRKGQLAIGLAFVAVLLFMCLYYRFAGLVASIALLANLILTVAAMVMVNATFTLPGLAGLVLMLGMAVDANVLIYERLREERDRGATLALAIRNGYDRALPTIIDTHLTSIFTSLVLWAIGNDQLKGFGISLTIGLVISLFTSLYMTRVIFDVWAHLQARNNLSMARWVPHTNFDFMAIRNYWFTATIILTILGIGLFLYRGEEGLNIDFTGGVAYGGRLEKPLDIQLLRDLLDQDRKDASGQRVLTPQAKPLDPDAEGKTRNYEVTYLGDPKVRRLQLIEPATEADVSRRLSQLPDLSLETISVGEEDTRGVSRFFTARTSEKDSDIVRVVINRLLENNEDSKNLKRIQLTSFTIDDNAKGASLVFDDIASPTQVAVLLKAELERMGLKDQAQQFEVVPKGDVQGGRSTTMRVELTEAMDRGKLDKALNATQAEFREHPQPERLEKFDSHLAAETRLRALYAVLASWAVILLYLWLRFGNWTFGLAAVLCLVHDLFFTMGIIAAAHYVHTTFFGSLLLLHDFKIDFAAVAALLTLVGYSVNDTIVVFDRIREVRGKNPQLTPQMINDSVNQTLSRTLLTSFITWLVVLVLYIWGGEGVHLFGFVMVVGVIVGTYSSIYIASPLLLIFGEGTKTRDVRGGERQPAPKPEGAMV